MAQYFLAYHGGNKPETPEDVARVMQAWGDWMGGMGTALVAPGNPVGLSRTVHAAGVDDNGGANPVSGYSIVEARDIDAAIEIAKGCPVIEDGGSVEVAEIVQM